jgi:quinohemoprotein ethanol dehydrogenase
VTPAVDPALGLVYLGTGNPIPELGGEESGRATISIPPRSSRSTSRPASCAGIIRLTHHDIYEMDLGTPLVLYDAKVKGAAQGIGVMRTDGYLFLLDRADRQAGSAGRGTAGAAERRLKTAPTQPFPVGADQVGPELRRPRTRVPAGFKPGCYFDIDRHRQART